MNKGSVEKEPHRKVCEYCFGGLTCTTTSQKRKANFFNFFVNAGSKESALF